MAEGNLTMNSESQIQHLLTAGGGEREKRIGAPLPRSLLPSLSPTTPTHPALPPSLYPSLFAGSTEAMGAGARALHLPDLERQGLGLGDPGGETIWLEDLGQRGDGTGGCPGEEGSCYRLGRNPLKL